MDALNFLALLLLAIGQAVVLVTLVNRSHALPIPSERLRHIRHAHDLLVPLFPIILFWQLGFSGPRLLFGGSWSDVHWGWWPYLSLCAVGACGLAISTMRYHLKSKPRLLESNHSDIVDIASQLDRPPIGDGPFAWMLRLPGNESLTVELNTKTLQLPRLPLEWEGVSVLHLSDWHFMGHVELPYYRRVVDLLLEQEFEMVLFTGDLLDDMELMKWIPETLGRFTAPLGCHFILGNHDWYLDSKAIRRQLCKLGWIDLAGRSMRVNRNGTFITLAGDETPWMGKRPTWADDDVAGIVRLPSEREFRILLSHTPDNIGWAREQKVDLMLSGHNHGGQVVLPITGPVYSPSRFGVKYAGGLYHEPPTALHVSRGLSGRHPLRFRCRPEVTRLVLKRA